MFRRNKLVKNQYLMFWQKHNPQIQILTLEWAKTNSNHISSKIHLPSHNSWKMQLCKIFWFFLKNNRMDTAYQNLSILYSILDKIIVSTAGAERSFNSWNLVSHISVINYWRTFVISCCDYYKQGRTWQKIWSLIMCLIHSVELKT